MGRKFEWSGGWCCLKKLHRGWWILFFIVLSVLACLGFGRFALGAILPFMKNGLDLSYGETGLVASAVFLGYLVSVTTVGHFVLRYKPKKVIVTSLFVITIGMVVDANAVGFWTAYIGSFLIGIGSGGAYIPSLGLLGQWFVRERKGMALGIAMAGAGIGIVFSGFAVPAIVGIDPISGWRFSWYILAIGVIIISIANWITIRNHPGELGLKPIGATSSQTQDVTDKASIGNSSDLVYKNKMIWLTGLNYFAWGFSYIIFSTFLVDYLMTDVGFDKQLAGTYFSISGVISIISGFLWGSISDRFGRMMTLSVVFGIQFFMLISISFTSSPLLLLVSVIIYSLTLWGVPTIMNASVSDFVHTPFVPVAMGFITLFFSIGQFISPVVTGFLIDISGSYFLALLLSAIASMLGGVGCGFLHKLTKHDPNHPSSQGKVKYQAVGQQD